MSKTIILIPSRLAAKRLPNKPLLKINGKSIISIVYKKAVKTKIGKVYVATGDEKIYQNINSNGGNCVLTKKNIKLEPIGFMKHLIFSVLVNTNMC